MEDSHRYIFSPKPPKHVQIRRVAGADSALDSDRFIGGKQGALVGKDPSIFFMTTPFRK